MRKEVAGPEDVVVAEYCDGRCYLQACNLELAEVLLKI